MKVGVIGTGHVGLPTAGTLAREAMALPVVVDGRNVFDPDEMSSHGFTYLPTGRPPIRP